jgi:hypothetical protein
VAKRRSRQTVKNLATSANIRRPLREKRFPALCSAIRPLRVLRKYLHAGGSGGFCDERERERERGSASSHLASKSANGSFFGGGGGGTLLFAMLHVVQVQPEKKTTTAKQQG